MHLLTRTLTTCGMALLLAGCSAATGRGSLRVESLGQTPGTLPARFNTAVYGGAESSLASFHLCDAPLEDLLAGQIDEGQYLHIELLWLPKAGKTPLSENALNMSVRHVIFAGGEFGVYGGAGFANPSDDVGSRRIDVSIPLASMTLVESSPGFVDRLGPAALTGHFTAVLDERLARRIGYAASQIVTNRLGRPRYVRADQTINALIAP